MTRPLFDSTMMSMLVISALALSAFAGPQAQAAQRKTVYTGLDCQPHDPQFATIDPATNSIVPTYSYYGSGIFNDETDPVDGFSDLGMNCTVDRTLFGPTAYLKSVTVKLTDVSDPTVPDDGGNCHTHIEYTSASTMNVIYGTDVYATDAGAGVWQTLKLPATDVAPTNDANYNIHCHISGQWSELNGYTVVEAN